MSNALPHQCFLSMALLAASIATGSNARLEAQELALETVVLRPMIEAEVPARQIGVLMNIAVDEGALVEEGRLLAALDDRAARLAVNKAQLERDQVAARAANRLRIAYADKALEVARAEMKRSRESNEQFARSISQSQLDVERLTVEKLQLERQQAEHDLELERFELQVKNSALEQAMLDLEFHSIKAPFTGVVSLIRGRQGEWVQPGAPVVRLVAIDKLRAEGFAPADAVAGSLVGATVHFTAPPDHAEATPMPPVAGTLRFVSPEIDPVSRQVRVWAEIDNAELTLRPGQQGRLVIPAPPRAGRQTSAAP